MDLYTNSKKKNEKKNKKKKNEDKKNKNEKKNEKKNENKKESKNENKNEKKNEKKKEKKNENKKENENEKEKQKQKQKEKETCIDATVWKFATREITASAARLLNADGQRWFVHVCASMLCSKRATLVRHTHIKRHERLFEAPQKRDDSAGGGEKLDLGGNKETLHAACLQLVQHRPGCRPPVSRCVRPPRLKKKIHKCIQCSRRRLLRCGHCRHTITRFSWPR